MISIGAVIGLMLLTFWIGIVAGLILGLAANMRDEAEADARSKARRDAVHYTVAGEAVSKDYAKSVWDERQGSYVIPPTAPHQF